MLNASVGLSIDGNSRGAGLEAVKNALGGLNGKPKLAILAVDHLTRNKFKYEDIISAVRSELDKEIPIIGSTVCGVMVNERLTLRSVGVMLLGGDINIDSHFVYEKSRINYSKIAADLLKIKSGIPKKDQQLMLMFQDGPQFPAETLAQQRSLNSRAVSLLSSLITKIFKKQLEEFWEKGLGFPSVQELLTKLYSNGWDIPTIGNIATNPEDFVHFEFYDNKVLDDAICGVIMSPEGNTKFGHDLIQGAIPTGISCEPTKKIGNFLLKIDGKPALKGFCNAFNIEKESLKELENQGYLNYYHVFGKQENVDGRDLYHLTLTMTDPELDNLVISGFPFENVPKKIELFTSNAKLTLNSVDTVMKSAMSGINEPRFLFGIDCVNRWSSMGDNLDKYIESIQENIGNDVPTLMVGAGGEIYGNQKIDYYNNNQTFIPFIGGN